MSDAVLAVDPERARSLARRLVELADRLANDAAELRVQLVELQLGAGGLAARTSLERAANVLWHDATFLELVCSDVTAADAGALWQVAVGPVGRRGLLGPWQAASGASPISGDLGGTFDAEARRPVVALPGPGAERARSLVGRLLADTADPSRIRADEFGLVQVAEDRFIVVLPGVTDLTDLDLGHSERHRSVRDLDRYAVRSSRSTSVDGNAYAAMVWEALEALDLPSGARLMIVGHSFGADTALDLASDPRFNGERFDVTHVVAAGYHSRPQLPDVANATEVLVVQNRHDLVVTAERVGGSSVADSAVSRVRLIGDVLRLDTVAAVGRSREILGHDLDALDELRDVAVTHADDVGELALGAVTSDVRRTKRAAAELVADEARVERVGDHAVVDVFDGGHGGAGHHPSNYVEHLGDLDALDPAVVEFLASVDDAGYAGPGSSVAVDVSVPQ